MSDEPPRHDAPPDDESVQPLRSLMFRTTALLGLGLALAAGVLVLLFRPYLGAAFEQESSELLRDQAARARTAAEVDSEVTVSLLRTSTAKAWNSATTAIADLPLELVTADDKAVRALAAGRLDGLAGAAADNVDELATELRSRTARRLGRDARRVAERNAERAEEFGDSMARRAAAILLALVAALFLLHGALLYRNVLSPVRRLGEATRDVARGELGTRIPVSGNDEVAALASSFNTMTGSLETARSDLESLNAALEDRVQQKTAELRAALDESREANRRLERTMSELREKERELRHAEKMASLGTLAGGVAHEFNNLLGGILGCAEDAARETDPDEMRDTLAMIERTARRGTAITQNLLRFARPPAGGDEDIDLASLLHDVADLIGPEATQHGVSVEVAAADDLDVRGDASGMHQVLLNLATNAIHAMPHGGRLELAAVTRGDEVELRVADTGLGIAPEHRDRLFEPFFTTRGPSGTGLGLSVTYGIVKAHGGRIDVESEPGRGTTFRVTLPAGERATRDEGGDR